MRKRTRKPTASQRDKSSIATAKHLKATGVLSKQTKLHGGRYVSRGVLKRVREHGWIIQNNQKAVKVSRDLLERAKEQGLHTVGNRIVVPKDRVSTKRLEQKILTGVKYIPGGQLQEVHLPFDTMSEFLVALQSGKLDRMKESREMFAFRYFKGMSNGFRDSKHLLEWLIKYDSITNPLTGDLLSNLDQQYSNFTLYKLLPGMGNPPIYLEERKERQDRRFSIQADQDRRVQYRRKLRVHERSALVVERRREHDAVRKKNERDRLREENPAKYREMLDANKARMIASRERRKNK